jgi:membrane protein required for colicin V production
MNWLDIVLIVLLVIQGFIGLRQGLIRAILSLIGMIAGVFLAGRYYQTAAGVFNFIGNDSLASDLGFILRIALFMMAAFILAFGLRSLIHAGMLGIFDTIGGAVFGFISGFLFLGALLAVWVRFFGNSALSESLLARTMLEYFPVVLGLLPGDFGNDVRNFFK